MNFKERASSRIPIRFSDEDEGRAAKPTPDLRDEESQSVSSGANRTAGNRDEGEGTMRSEADESPSRPTHNQSSAAESSDPATPELVEARVEVRRVEAELQKALLEQKDLRETAARRQADFENYRKRIERERGESYQRTLGEIVTQLLPVADNLRRAVETETSVGADESEEFRRFLHGVELVSKQLSGVLETFGVEPVETVGRPFDPHVHEAVATEQSDVHEPDTVVAEIARGYRLGGRLLRPALVKVAK